MRDPDFERREPDEYDEGSVLPELTTAIVCAYVSNNALSANDLPGMIGDVHDALSRLGDAAAEAAAQAEPPTPAVPIRKSISSDFIICLEDGGKFKSLKRHLKSKYGLTPEAYREKWGLPADYPMVAPSYSAVRSKLAKDNLLGQKPAFAGAPS